jgi:hypothetical protein
MAIELIEKLKAKGPLKIPYWGWALGGGAALYLGYRWWSTRQDAQADGSQPLDLVSGAVPSGGGAGAGFDPGLAVPIPPLLPIPAEPGGILPGPGGGKSGRQCPQGFHQSLVTRQCVENKGHGKNGGTGTGTPPPGKRTCPPGYHQHRTSPTGAVRCVKNKGNKATAARTVSPVVPTTSGSRTAARTTSARSPNQVAVTRGTSPSILPIRNVYGNYTGGLTRVGGIGGTWGGGGR